MMIRIKDNTIVNTSHIEGAWVNYKGEVNLSISGFSQVTVVDNKYAGSFLRQINLELYDYRKEVLSYLRGF